MDLATPLLPTDIVRKVIGYSAQANDSVVEIRLACREWNDLVNEELSLISNLPIEEMTITSNKYDPDEKDFWITVDLKIKKEGPLRHLYRYGFLDMEESDDYKIASLRQNFQFNEVLHKSVNVLGAMRIVKKLILTELHGRLIYLPYIFPNIEPIDEVHVKETDLNTDYCEALIKLLRQWNVAKLHLEIANYTSNKIPKRLFLLQLASLVDFLHIEQRFSINSAYREFTYLIDSDGAQTIYEMLGKRLSKLKIDHDNYELVANEDALNELLEKVASYEAKAPWFEMNAAFPCNANLERMYLNARRNGVPPPLGLYTFLFAPFSMRRRVKDTVLRVGNTTYEVPKAKTLEASKPNEFAMNMEIPLLPADILRKVIGNLAQANNSLTEIRLVSHLWNDLVNDELSLISNIPIEEMVITENNDSLVTGILITVDVKVKKEVSPRHLYRYGFVDVDSCDNRMTSLRIHLTIGEVVENIKKKQESNGLFALGQIKRVVLDRLDEIGTACAGMFRNIQANEIYLKNHDLTTNIRNSIPKIVSHWKARKLHMDISARLFQLIASDEFLLQLADLVDVLHIDQRNCAPILRSQNSSYLINDSNFNIIHAMFGKRVSTIKVEHNNLMIVAKEECLISLLKITRLSPKIRPESVSESKIEKVAEYPDKKPWFEINATYPVPGFNYNNRSAIPPMLNRHVPSSPFSMRKRANDVKLKVLHDSKIMNNGCAISLKHRTRANEEFHSISLE